jgi:CBS-domain-containing membrane protein
MAKLGIPHPPAGANAVIYASGEYGWMFYLLVVLSSIISILPAIMVNNFSEKRHYPTYWGYVPLYMKNLIRHFVGVDFFKKKIGCPHLGHSRNGE